MKKNKKQEQEKGETTQEFPLFPTKNAGSVAEVSPPQEQDKEKEIKKESFFSHVSHITNGFLGSFFSKFKLKPKENKPREVMRMANIQQNEDHNMVDNIQQTQPAQTEQQKITFEQLPLTEQIKVILSALEMVMNNQQVIYNEITSLKAQGQQSDIKPQKAE